ncbi:MAG: TraB/GumN family protein [Nanoarchaeota archaeon]
MEKKLIIVGTSHIAKDSVEKVKETILKFKPDVVGIELDVLRYKNLVLEYKNKNRANKKYSYISSIRQIGFKGFIFAMFGSYGIKKLSKYTGTKPGGEMLEASLIANQNNIKVALIDQNINVTLSDFSKSLTFREIMKFFADFFKALFNPKKQIKELGISFNLNEVPKEEVIEKMINYLKFRYPSIYNVLVHKRNVYMSKKIIHLMKRDDINKMVVVVGAGHKKGMIDFLNEQPSAVFDIEVVL